MFAASILPTLSSLRFLVLAEGIVFSLAYSKFSSVMRELKLFSLEVYVILSGPLEDFGICLLSFSVFYRRLRFVSGFVSENEKP